MALYNSGLSQNHFSHQEHGFKITAANLECRADELYTVMSPRVYFKQQIARCFDNKIYLILNAQK